MSKENNIFLNKMKQTLNQIISEVIERFMAKNVILEMAFNRAAYKERVNALLDQLLQNWCLVKYCSITKNDNINKNHWIGELKGILATIARFNIKGNNSAISRAKALKNVWNDNDFDSDIKCVELAIYNKFKEEKIDITNIAYKTVLTECVNNYNEIINIIVKKSPTAIDDYVNSL
jgi:hypothetical protein